MCDYRVHFPRWFACGWLAFLISGCGDPSVRDANLLQGTWEDHEKSVWTVQGDTITVAGRPGKKTFKVNASRSPKEIDFINEKGQPEASIYALNGDAWQLNLPSRSGGERPAKIDPTGRYGVLTRKR